jgi:excisionase family DNA binding protein
LKTETFDPVAYIENAFLDTRKVDLIPDSFDEEELELQVLTKEAATDELSSGDAGIQTKPSETARFRKTVMSAPRPRRSKSQVQESTIEPYLNDTWTALPKNVAFLCSFFDDGVTKNYYRGEFKESRQELIRRLLDPELSLEETARLLGVCPATVRRYTNRHWLSHHRTEGGQRRFRLSNIVQFVDEHGRLPQE